MCLGHVLRMRTERLSHCALFSETGKGWRMSRDGAVNDMAKSMKILTSKLPIVSSVRLSG